MYFPEDDPGRIETCWKHWAVLLKVGMPHHNLVRYLLVLFSRESSQTAEEGESLQE